jgi:hypothetical protein
MPEFNQYGFGLKPPVRGRSWPDSTAGLSVPMAGISADRATYAIYASSHGAAEAEIEAAIQSRDLSHKGGERRQADYVGRTIKKAFESGRTQSRGR